MTPEEHGRHLASLEPPITDEMARQAARIFVSAMRLAAQDAA